MVGVNVYDDAREFLIPVQTKIFGLKSSLIVDLSEARHWASDPAAAATAPSRYVEAIKQKSEKLLEIGASTCECCELRLRSGRTVKASKSSRPCELATSQWTDDV
jgi:hypothetical protein